MRVAHHRHSNASAHSVHQPIRIPVRAIRPRQWAGLIAAGLAVTLGLSTYFSYRADISAARQRVATGAKVINTAAGPIQYADVGKGPPVLMIHGAGGGFDQGHWGFRDGLGDVSYRVIAPSRFGYLDTPLPKGDASPIAQADAHAALLDALGIERVAVVGASAGALSAMQFAIRYPERTTALVLNVPASWAPPEEKPAEVLMDNPFVLNVVMKSDFVMWAVMKLAPNEMVTFVGVPKELQSTMTPAQRARVNELIELIQPVSQRKDGIVNDGINSSSLGRYPLEEIRAPTLVIDAADVSTFPGSRYTAAHIPSATFLAYETGGHLLVGHEEHSRAAVAALLQEHHAAPTATAPAGAAVP
jgi:2-hydroxy-6-oxonona-2,4-dienedioate hydrolase